jgi:hypothetical protein
MNINATQTESMGTFTCSPPANERSIVMVQLEHDSIEHMKQS